MTTTNITTDDLVELDERESNGMRVTLVWNRATNRVSVLVSDEQSGEAFALAVQRDDNAFDVFHHPFAYFANRFCNDGLGGCAERLGTSC